MDGVGSARQLNKLCQEHLAYRWLCGGVSMNYHTLADFRTAHGAVLERLLADGVAALVAEGLVALDVLAQDGMRVRAAAGAGSFRRRQRLEELAVAAKARVERLRTELASDPAVGNRRQQAAQQRAAREREERVKAALDRMPELEAERARRAKKNKAQVAKQKEPRASTTDAAARSMKMADGGFRPAYNLQIVSVPQRRSSLPSMSIRPAPITGWCGAAWSNWPPATSSRPTTWSMAALPRTKTSNGRISAAPDCGARRCATSTALSLMRRAPRTAREWRIGASGWRASAAP